MHHPGSPKLKYWDITVPKSHFFSSSVIITPKHSGGLWPRWWLDLIFHFLCGVTVGSYFMFSSGDNSSFAVFPSSPFWHFSFLPCDSGSKCFHSWLFRSSIAALASVWSRSPERRAEEGALLPSADWRIIFVSILLFKGTMRQLGVKEQLKTLVSLPSEKLFRLLISSNWKLWTWRMWAKE